VNVFLEYLTGSIPSTAVDLTLTVSTCIVFNVSLDWHPRICNCSCIGNSRLI